MSGVIAGFTVIFVVIAVGYIIARAGVLGDAGEQVLGRLVFFVATPALLFETLARADLRSVFSPTLAVTSVSAFAVGAAYFAGALVAKRHVADATVGALSASYVNASNLGIPIAVYVLGDASFVAPLLLFQILVYSPLALTLLDVSTSKAGASLRATVTAPFRNPIVLAALAGLVVAAVGLDLPDPLMQPIVLIGGASVPGALLAFGMSLYGVRVLQRGTSPRRDVAVAAALKMLVLPVLAWVLARFVWHLEGTELFGVVVIASLPTAQNVFIYASRYGRGVVLARDSAFVTTLISIPVIALVSALLT
ncbi:membrane protein [Rhodococcoides trifolii]|uniref:Membrane protein n=1 Tax=Rhodococcoides trifolii TaxID=908250 RepID=A0A917G184_9NOCA|nr:AEC family transporter [Rhodococcus trifolii]GGG17653.1 membrane protein [Rhodococcus trifolii]